MLDLTPLAHRSYLAEVERSARARRRVWPRARPKAAARAIAAARRLFVSLKIREA